MNSKVMINVESAKPLSSYGKSHALLFDEKKNCYIAVERDSFLKPQNDRIERLEKQFADTVKTLQADYAKNIADSDKKYNDFLKTYKATNAMIIDMVKTFASNDNKGENGDD